MILTVGNSGKPVHVPDDVPVQYVQHHLTGGRPVPCRKRNARVMWYFFFGRGETINVLLGDVNRVTIIIGGACSCLGSNNGKRVTRAKYVQFRCVQQ